MKTFLPANAYKREHYTIYALAIMLLLLFSNVAHSQIEEQPLYRLPDVRDRLTRSNSIALARDGRNLIVANMLDNTVSVVFPFEPRIDAEIPVGLDPRTVAVTPDNNIVLSVNRGDGTISVINLNQLVVEDTIDIGLLPYGVVIKDNNTAFVSVQGENVIVQIDLTTRTVTERIPTADSPAGLSLWGDYLYVTHLWTGDLSMIHTAQKRVVDRISVGADVSVSQAVTIDPLNGIAYLPQTHLFSSNPAPTFDSMIFPIVNVVDLRFMRLEVDQRLALNTIDRPVNMPFSITIDPQRRWMYVVNAGSNDVTVVDLVTGLGIDHIRAGVNPRGSVLSLDGGTLYIHNMIDGTVSVFDVTERSVTDVLPINNSSVPADIFFGAQWFNTSADSRLTTDRWVSCASCHFDGLTDKRVWLGYGNAPVNTPVLFGLADSAPYNHLGTWIELADVENKIRDWHAGGGLIDELILSGAQPLGGMSLDLDNLGTYMLSLTGPQFQSNETDTEIEAGRELFEEADCASCHSGPSYTNGQQYDVGTGGVIDTPTLLWLRISEPYFHDGRAETLRDVFTMPGTHHISNEISYEQIDLLIKYLNSLSSP